MKRKINKQLICIALIGISGYHVLDVCSFL